MADMTGFPPMEGFPPVSGFPPMTGFPPVAGSKKGSRHQEEWEGMEKWDSEEEIEPPVEPETGYSSVLIVDNIPTKAKLKEGETIVGKIRALLNKLFNGYSKIQGKPADAIFIPTNSDQETKGYAFIEMVDEAAVARAVKHLDGYKLDASHTLRVVPYDDLARLMDYPEEYVAPELPEHEPEPETGWWLEDVTDKGYATGREMYYTRYADISEVLWGPSDAVNTPKSIHRRAGWSDILQWSPHGTYLATFHPPGIALWGGPQWSRLRRFDHDNVKVVLFSPNEKYVITWTDAAEDDTPKSPTALKVWETSTGRLIRAFPANTPPLPEWPVFKISHDDRYFARLEIDKITVYEITEAGMKKSGSAIRIPGIRDFDWCPTDNILSAYIPGVEDAPTSVQLMRFPEREVIRSQNFVGVLDCRMNWQESGHYFAVKVERAKSKSKKSSATTFALFRMKEKGIPVDLHELEDDVHAFAWEPKGHKFILIHGIPPKPSVSLWSMLDKKKAKKLTCLQTAHKQPANTIFWSPEGRFVVLAGFGPLNGALAFWDTQLIQTLHTAEHYMANQVSWDPTGRVVATVAAAGRNQTDTGYTLWSAEGKPLHSFVRDKFYDFAWRPRPPTLLSQEKQEELEANLKDYSEKYSKEFSELKQAANAQESLRRAELEAEFRTMLAEWRSAASSEDEELHAIPGVRSAADAAEDVLEEVQEQIVSEDTQVLYRPS